MVAIRHIVITLSQLEAIPDSERRLLILVAHAANELNSLSKLFHYSATATAKDPILLQAENAQALVLARLLTGKIYECWQLLQSSFFGNALSKMYHPLLDDDTLQSLGALKRYFSHENVIALMRNHFAFHYSPDQIDAGYKALVDGDALDVYLATEDGNTFFAFADTITGRAMLETIRPGNPEAAFETLVNDTVNSVKNLNNVIASLMAICFKKKFGDDFFMKNSTLVNVEGVPESVSVHIPYFIEFPSDANSSK